MAKYRFEDIAYNSTEKKKPVEEDKYTYIGLEHLDPQCLEVTRYGSEVAPIGEKLVMKKGDVLFGKRRAYQKKVAIAPFDGIFSAHGMVLRPKEKVIDPKFFPMFIASDYFLDSAIKISVGSLSPTINWSTLKELEFELPDLNKQHELAELLWAAEETKNAYKNFLKCNDAMIETEFIKRFGNLLESNKTRMTIEELSILFCDGDWIEVKDQAESGIRLIQTGNIGIGDFINKEEKSRYINEKTFINLNCTEVYPGDILISRLPDPIGRACIMPNIKERMITAVDCAIFRPKEFLDKKFFIAFTLTNLYKSQIQKYETGSTRKRISRKNLGLIQVPIPAIQYQKAYVDFADKCINVRFSHEQMIANIINMQKATLNNLLKEVSHV